MIYGATLTAIAAPDPIPEDDELALLMLALSPDMYLRHGDVEGEFLADSSGEDNRGTVVGSLSSWGVDPELSDPVNLDRAITYGGTGSVSVALSSEAVATYGIRFKPTQSDIDNSVAIMGKNTDGANNGNWSLRLVSGGSIRVFCQNGGSTYSINSATALITAGTWAHVYVVLSGSGFSLYHNGDLIDTNTNHTIGETGNSLPFVIGASNYTSNFSGTIHEVVRYTTALNATQIDDRSFGETSAPPPEPDDYPTMPTQLSSVTVSSTAALISAIDNAPPGRHILVDAGTYSGFSATFGGTQESPVVVRPSDPNNPPMITGTSNFYGTAGQFWGIHFKNTQSGASPGTRIIRFYGNDIRLIFCDLEIAGVGPEIADVSVRRTWIERCHFYGQIQGTSGNGQDALKLGVSQSLTEPHATTVQLNLFEGYAAERECVSIKGEVNFRRNHLIGCRQIALRHCRSCIIDENRIEDPAEDNDTGRIQVSGPDHTIRGNIGTLITVDRGTDDGDADLDGSSQVYLAAKRTIVQNNTMSNAIRVGDYVFSVASNFDTAPTGTLVSGNSIPPTAFYGATWGTAPTVTSQDPPTLTSLTTGLGAYAAIYG